MSFPMSTLSPGFERANNKNTDTATAINIVATLRVNVRTQKDKTE